MPSSSLITSTSRAIVSLAPAVSNLRTLDAERGASQRAIERGHVTPEEEECVRSWFARYLTARAGLLEIIAELTPMARREVPGVDEEAQLRCFIVGYTAACLLVRAGRIFVDEIATHKIVQRKLNEAAPAYRIPRKQYTAIYRSLTNPANAWKLADALRFADAHRRDIDALTDDPELGPVIGYLNEAEESLRIGATRYLKARLRYRWHSWRRRRATAWQQCFFGIAEAFGRVIADIHNPFHVDRVTPEVQRAIAALLQPGDVLIARHDDAMSNLLLPGYWPHACLHVGLPAVREHLPIRIDDRRAARWVDPLRVLEARKDGVLLRALDDTLATDAVAVLRPRLDSADIAAAISNALAHEGKLYNFDFDFFRDDKLVCTEVVYRAYEGVGGIAFTLTQRSGRPTLSAEDILSLALEDRGFEAAAVFGTPGVSDRLVIGHQAAKALAANRQIDS